MTHIGTFASLQANPTKPPHTFLTVLCRSDTAESDFICLATNFGPTDAKFVVFLFLDERNCARKSSIDIAR
jgi:hypothetical protein